MCDEQLSQGGGDMLSAKEKGIALCKELATSYDTIRCKYWDYMASTLERRDTNINDINASTSSTEN